MMQALVRPEDVPVAALEAVSRVRAGEWSRAEAVDSVYDRAIAGGLVRLYGEDVVQVWLSGAFSMLDDEMVSVTLQEDTTNALDNNGLDARAIAQTSFLRVTAISLERFLAMDGASAKACASSRRRDAGHDLARDVARHYASEPTEASRTRLFQNRRRRSPERWTAGFSESGCTAIL